MRRAAFVTSPELWQHGHGPQHPMKPERLRRTFELLSELGALEAENVQVLEARPATPDELALFHTEEYIEVTRQLSEEATAISERSSTGKAPAPASEFSLPAGRYGFGPGDNPVFAGMYQSEALKTGAALQAAELIIDGQCEVAFSYGGGLHHAGSEFASGFCVFNDCAVAIQWLLERGQRVAYVDIDVHHGDGVQNAFYDSDQVLTISIHQDPRTLFPGTGFVEETGEGSGEGFCINVPLPPLTYDEPYLRAFYEIVPAALERFGADIVVTQLGVDTHYSDPLASLALTTDAHELLYRALEGLAPRWLALGGGGYAIELVPRSWALAFGVMSGQTLQKTLPKGYQERYGGRYLRDQEQPKLSEAIRLRVDEVVDELIRQVKQIHHLP